MTYVIEAYGLTKYFGTAKIFQNLELALDKGEKAGLIGANGAGKTTLLNCLCGREPLDEGNVHFAAFSSAGYLEQIQNIDDQQTLMEAVMEAFSDIFAQREKISRLEQEMSHVTGRELEKVLQKYGALREAYERDGGFACEAQVRRVLAGLGFREEQYDQAFGSFSGGEKTRVGLAKILARDYDLLFLDEPTNHLDLASVEWLEGFLAGYRGALLVISHDRFFLDKVTETTFNLENGSLKRYKGNYSVFFEKRQAELEAELRAYEKQQQEIRETEEYILRFKAGIKSRQARGRQTRLDRLERLEKPGQDRRLNMGTAEIDGRTGEKVLVLDKLAFGYPEKPIFCQLSAEIRFGERVALLGPNGVGKTTLLKVILGQLKPKEGGAYLGARVKPAYFDQEHSNLDPENTVMEEILKNYDLTVEETRGVLARFLFGPEDLEKPIGTLSGGEQGRLSLLKLTLEKGNFLILDEPTNHLDLFSREAMEDYLRDYPGTILMISHDRYFLDQIAQRILEMSPRGLVSYLGNYTEYREKKEQEKTTAAENITSDNPTDKLSALPQKPDKAEERAAENTGIGKKQGLDRFAKARLRQMIQALEKEIQQLEERQSEISELLTLPETYSSDDANRQIKALNLELASLHERLPQAYREWEDAAAALEDG